MDSFRVKPKGRAQTSQGSYAGYDTDDFPVVKYIFDSISETFSAKTRFEL